MPPLLGRPRFAAGFPGHLRTADDLRSRLFYWIRKGVAGCTVADEDSRDASSRSPPLRFLRRCRSSLGQGHRHKDVEKFVAYYADDATVLMPNASALHGKEAIRAALKRMLDPISLTRFRIVGRKRPRAAILSTLRVPTR